jgi:hypothetical protein
MKLEAVRTPGQETAPAPETRDPHWIARRNAVGLRQILSIAETLELTQTQLGTLLGATPRSLQRWRAQADDSGELALSADTVERMSYLLGIWKALCILFPTAANRVLWLRNGNAAPVFNGQAPLERMLAGQVADLYSVRRYLDGMRG